eukprot:COSAG04_NODE_33_length_34808_cov_6.920366_6_plen_131_part_00
MPWWGYQISFFQTAYLPTPAHLVQNQPRAYLPTPTQCQLLLHATALALAQSVARTEFRVVQSARVVQSKAANVAIAAGQAERSLALPSLANVGSLASSSPAASASSSLPKVAHPARAPQPMEMEGLAGVF